jgi:hypothetical protein
MLVVGFMVLLYFKSRKITLDRAQSLSISLLLILVFVQFALGVLPIIRCTIVVRINTSNQCFFPFIGDDIYFTWVVKITTYHYIYL